MDFLSLDEQNHLKKHLVLVVKSLKDISDEKLQFYLFLEMTKVAGLKGVRYTTKEHIDQQTSKIIDETYHLLEKQEKNFLTNKVYSNDSKLKQIIIYQIDKLLLKLTKEYDGSNKENKLALAKEIVLFLNSLSNEEQKQLMKELGMTSLGADIVNKLNNQMGLELVLTHLKRAGGFTFYIILAPILINFFGKSLPKDHIIDHKWVIDSTNILTLIGLNNIVWSMQHIDLQKRLLPIIMMQMSLLYLNSDDEHNLDTSTFIREWKNRFQKYVSLKKDQVRIESKQKDVRDDIKKKVELLQQAEVNISNCLNSIKKERDSILSKLKMTDLQTLTISNTFQQYCVELHKKKAKMEEIKSAQSTPPDTGSILKIVGQSFSKLYRDFNLIEEEKKLDMIYHKMIDEILTAPSTGTFCRKEKLRYNDLTRLLNQLNKQKTLELQNKRDLENKLVSINKEHSKSTQIILENENDNYGLKDILLSQEDFLLIDQEFQEGINNKSERNEDYWKKKQLFINDYENKISSLEQQNKQLLADLKTKESKLNTLEQQSENLENKIKELTAYKLKAGELEQKNKDLLSENKKLIEENEKQTKRLLKEQNSNWEYKYQELKEAAEQQINKQIQQVNQKWQMKLEQLEVKNREIVEALQQENMRFQKDTINSKNTITYLEQQLEEIEKNQKMFLDQRLSLDIQIKELEECLNQTKEENNELKVQTKNIITNHEYQLKHLDEKWEMKQAELVDKYEETFRKLVVQLREKETEIRTLQEELKSLKEENQHWNQLLELTEQFEKKMEEKNIELYSRKQAVNKLDEIDFDESPFEVDIKKESNNPL